MGTLGKMLDPSKRSPWQGGDGTQTVLDSPIMWDGVLPSMGTGAIPCQCCPGIPVVLRQGRGLQRRGREHIWEGLSPQGSCGSCLAASRHAGWGALYNWFVHHQGFGGTGGTGAKTLQSCFNSSTAANWPGEAESIAVTSYCWRNAREHQPVNQGLGKPAGIQGFGGFK